MKKKAFLHLYVLIMCGYAPLELTRLILIWWAWQNWCFDWDYIIELSLMWMAYASLWIFWIKGVKDEK